MTLRSLFVKLGFKTDLSGLGKFEKSIDNAKGSMLTLTAAATVATGVIGKFIYEAAKIEQVQIAFKVMTGSAELGKKTLNDLFDFARYTPFQIPQVLKVATMLKSMKVETENLTETLGQVGDVAAGLPMQPFEELAYIYGKVKAAGYMTGEELRSLRRHGVGIMDELEKMTGKPQIELMHMVRKQQITFDMFSKAWKQMTSEGGLFHRMMIEQSKTLIGLWNNIKDSILIGMIKSGERLLPIAKKIALNFYDILDTNKELINSKLTTFFGRVSRVMDLMHKSSLYIFSDIISITNSLGGLNRVIQVLSFLLAMYFGSHALMIVGKIATMSISFLTLANVKLMIIGAAFLFLILVVTDFFGYLEGKESVLGRFLDYFKVKFPEAFEEMSSALKILKAEIEGITLFWMGVFTGDKAMRSYGLSQIQESFGMMQEEGGRQASSGNMISRIPTKQINTPAGPNDSWWKKLISGSKKGSPSLWQELMGRRGNEATMNFPVATARDEWSLSNPSEITKSNVMSFNMPVEVNFSNVPNGITAEQMVPILKNTMIQTIDGRLDEILRSNRSSVESRQY